MASDMARHWPESHPPAWALLVMGRRGWWGYGLAIAAITLVSGLIALLEQWWAPTVSLSMLHLIAVLAVAATAGRGPAVVAGVLAFLTFDFLFVEPRHTFTIRDPNEWLALLLFLLTAIVTGELAAALRRQAAAADRRARETATLYDLSRTLTAAVGLPATLAAIVERVVAVFDVGSCTVLLPGADGTPVVAATAGAVAPATGVDPNAQTAAQRVLLTGRSLGLGWSPGHQRRATPLDQRALYLPLVTGGRTLGVLRVGATRDGQQLGLNEERTLATFAAQAALAIAQAELADERTRAEIARRGDLLKSALLSSVSHDLRTPLASIKTAVTSLLQPGVVWDDGSRQEFLTAIDEEADRLTRLVTNLLDLSRIEAGALRPAADWVDIGETITSVVRRLRPRLASHPLAVAAPDDLPLARVDPVHLEQALGNLLENSAKYTPAGTPIEIVVGLGSTALEVAIADHGPGIPARARDRVFEKFARLGRDQGRTTGTGLGLAIVRGLVEANGGRVWVDETPGGGATFRLTVPVGEVVPMRPVTHVAGEGPLG